MSSPRHAALWMLGAIISFPLMAIAAREVSSDISTFQLLFMRSLLGIALVGSIALWRGPTLLITRRPGLQLWRNVMHFTGQYAWFYALTLIPIAQVFAIEFTTPLWVALLAPLLLGEQLTRARLAAVILGFGGILLVLRPGVVPINTGSLAMLLGALGFALSFIAVKRLTSSDSSLAIVFYMSLIQAPISAIPAISGWVSVQPADWPWIVIIGCGALVAHFCISQAFRHADALVVGPVDFLRLPLAMLVGWLLYAEAVDLWLAVGAALVLCGNWLNLRDTAPPIRAIKTAD